jgi:sulfonate transport system permease protein
MTTVAIPPPSRAGRPGVALARAARLGRGWRRLLSPIAIVLLWQLASNAGWLDPRTLAPPSDVLSAGRELLANGELQHHLWVSLGRVVKGLSLGVVAGTVLALVAGLSRLGEDLIDPPVQMIRTVPVLALTPLFILWFGIGEETKYLMIALGTTFPIYLNTFAGIRGIDSRLVDAAHTLGLSRWAIVRRVILPGALPGFLTGLRYSAGIAWLVLVVGEQINATSGIGYLITQARTSFQTDVIVLGLAIYALLGLTTDLVVRAIESKALAWRPTFTGS